MRNASGHQGENEWQRKKVNRNTYNISSIKRVKFHFVVVQNNGKEMYKKSVLHVQSCFFLLIRPADFLGSFCCRRRLACIARFYILFE